MHDLRWETKKETTTAMEQRRWPRDGGAHVRREGDQLIKYSVSVWPASQHYLRIDILPSSGFTSMFGLDLQQIYGYVGVSTLKQ
jgi:hypothetical protein